MLTPVRVTIPEGKQLPQDSRGYTRRVYNGYTGYADLSPAMLAMLDERGERIPVYRRVACVGSEVIAMFERDELTPMN